MLKHLSKEGSKLIARDENNRIVRNSDGTQKVGTLPRKSDVPLRGLQKREKREKDSVTFRRALKQLTDNGADVHRVLISLMHGTITVPQGKDPEGNTLYGAPQIPTPEVRRAAAMNLHEILFGKAVEETSVNEAEREAEKTRQLDAMSDEELQSYVKGEYTLEDDAPPDEDPI